MARYTEIAAQLKQRIRDADYFPGDRLPSNRELGAEFDTTVATVRQALALLEETGWLRVEHGVGTFVADLGASDMLASLTSRGIEGGPSLATQLAGVEADVQHTGAAQALGLPPEAALVRVDRLRLVDRQPTIWQSSYLSGVHTQALKRYTATVPLYVFLRDKLRLVATRSHETISAVRATPAQSEVLLVEPGDPLLRSVKTSRADDGDAFIFDDAVIVPQRLDVEIDRHGTRCDVRFGVVPQNVEAGDELVSL